MKVSVVLDAPTFTVGQQVMCQGETYRGIGTVKEIRQPGEGQATNDTYPQVIVKPDAGFYGPRYGNRSLIRYNGDDLVAGKIVPYVPPAPIAAPVAAPVDIPDRAMAPAVDTDKLVAFVNMLEDAATDFADALKRAAEYFTDNSDDDEPDDDEGSDPC